MEAIYKNHGFPNLFFPKFLFFLLKCYGLAILSFFSKKKSKLKKFKWKTLNLGKKKKT